MLKPLCAITGILWLPCWAAPAKVLWDVATAHFVPRLAHPALPQHQHWIWGKEIPLWQRGATEARRVDSASWTELSVGVVFLTPPVKIIFLQTCGWSTWAQHLMSHPSAIISGRSPKCDLRYPPGTQPVCLCKEGNLNYREMTNKNRHLTTGSLRPIQDPPSCLFF